MTDIYLTMETGVHSGVSTPTMVRSRPKLPPMAGPGTQPGGIKKTTSDPSTSQEVEDLVGVLNSLGNTDYIGKYSRKRKTSSGLSSPTPSVSSISLPMSPMSPITSPGAQTPPLEQRAMGTITLTRMRSIKLKLEKVKETQERERGEARGSGQSVAPSSGGHHVPKRRTGCVERPRVGLTMDYQRSADKSEVNDMSVRPRDSPSPEGSTHSSQPVVVDGSGIMRTTPGGMDETGVSSSVSQTVPTTHSSTADMGLAWSTTSVVNTALTTCAHAGSVSDSQSSGVPMDLDKMETCLQVMEDGDLPVRGVMAPLVVTEQDAEDEGVGDIDGHNYKDTQASSLSITEESKSILKRSPSYKEAGDGIESKTSFTGSLRDSGIKASVKFTDDDTSNQGLQRYVEPGSNTNGGKVATGGRFLTHPPSRERPNSKEAGSVDSNGLGSLREGMEEVRTTGEMSSQVSLVSTVSTVSEDSHIAASDTNEPPTYRDVVLDVIAEGSDMDRNLERRNGKSQKPKSKSDPSGEREKESTAEFTPVISTHAQSTPMLSEEKDHVPQMPEFQTSEKERRKSKSDNILSSSCKEQRLSLEEEEMVREIPIGQDFLEEAQVLARHAKLRRSSKKRQRMAAQEAELKAAEKAAEALKEAEEQEKKKQKDQEIQKAAEADEEEKDLIAAMKPLSPRSRRVNRKPRSYTAPVTQETAPVASILDENVASLTLPLSKKSLAITRSHSAASFLQQQKDKSQGQGVRPKELPEKTRRSGRSAIMDSMGLKDSSPELHSPRLRDKQGIGIYSPKLEPIFSGSSLSLFEGNAEDRDKRSLIVEELANTERQYVDTLHMLVENYMIPLKTKGVLDSNLVDDIFYKINEIYMHHATFLAFLQVSTQNWDSHNTIGDVLLKTFSKQSVIQSYMSFIENFQRAEKVLDDLATKSSFQKFIEQTERETRSKLPLKAQIVKPIQRIPRYELLLKRLLENTPKEHPDHALLTSAEETIHNLALKINSVRESKNHEDLQETLKKLELLLITDLASPERIYMRHDMVQVLVSKYSRKDQCCIWLFSDLAIFTSIKRKSGPVNRKSTLLIQSSTGQEFVENTKHKVWLKIPLEDLEVVKNPNVVGKKELVDREQLEGDFSVLGQISDLAHQLKCPHQVTKDNLDETIRELMSQVNKQLSEHQLKSPPPLANKIELIATSLEGVTTIIVVFSTQERKSSWEALFTEAKQKLATLSNAKPPEFSQALPITKTRAGMQFSCASAMEGVNAQQQRDVWVCNSDGYVGHMCLLSLQPEPIVTLNTPVPGCNSRILCICALPAFHHMKRKGSGRKCDGRKGLIPTGAPKIRVSSTNSQDSADEDTLTDTSTSVSDEEDEGVGGLHLHADDDSSSVSSSPGKMNEGGKDGILGDPYRSTMWLGTEDGCIHIFLSTDNIKTTKHKVKVQLASSVLHIVYLDSKVFVSLANGQVIVYIRGKDDMWNLQEAETLALGSATSPITRMIAVAGKLWCACQHEILVLNTTLLHVETTFTGNPESRRAIHCMACSGQGVWLAAQGSSKVQLYHATTYQHLLEVSVTQAVAQKLQASDDIIRQHKTACLRITALLACKDLLWIGTSAGVILTLPMQKITTTTDKSNVVTPIVQGLVHGHTGHVRFLTSVELPSGVKTPEEGFAGQSLAKRRMSTSFHTVTLTSKMLVISGGDGYEDFRNNINNEAAGRDDSTNHLLLWQV